MLEIAKTKEELPQDTDLQCKYCKKNIDLDEKKEGVPNCVICPEGHRCHRDCFSAISVNNKCPICGEKDMRFCKSQAGYAYAEKKGGRGKKSKSKSYKKKKTCKRRKTYKKK
jgi:hypothetical protein